MEFLSKVLKESSRRKYLKEDSQKRY